MRCFLTGYSIFLVFFPFVNFFLYREGWLIFCLSSFSVLEKKFQPGLSRSIFLYFLCVIDIMVDTILASKMVTALDPHTFIPVIDRVNIKKLSCNLRRISLWTVTVILASVLQWQIFQKTLKSLIFISAHSYWLWWVWINLDVPFLLTF